MRLTPILGLLGNQPTPNGLLADNPSAADSSVFWEFVQSHQGDNEDGGQPAAGPYPSLADLIAEVIVQKNGEAEASDLFRIPSGHPDEGTPVQETGHRLPEVPDGEHPAAGLHLFEMPRQTAPSLAPPQAAPSTSPNEPLGATEAPLQTEAGTARPQNDESDLSVGFAPHAHPELQVPLRQAAERKPAQNGTDLATMSRLERPSPDRVISGSDVAQFEAESPTAAPTHGTGDQPRSEDPSLNQRALPEDLAARVEVRETPGQVLRAPAQTTASTDQPAADVPVRLDEPTPQVRVESPPVPASRVDISARPTQVTHQIVRGARFLSRTDLNQITIRLDPPELGEVTVQLASRDQAVTGEIRVENRSVQEIVQRNLAELKDALNGQGIQIDRLEVSVDGGGRSTVDREGNGGFLRDRTSREDASQRDRDNTTDYRDGAPEQDVERGRTQDGGIDFTA